VQYPLTPLPILLLLQELLSTKIEEEEEEEEEALPPPYHKDVNLHHRHLEGGEMPSEEETERLKSKRINPNQKILLPKT